MFKDSNGVAANQQRERTKDPETAVDETPAKRDAAYGTSNEGERYHACAGDKPEGDEPLIANRIDVWADECYGDNEMCKGKPVCSVGEKRVLGVGCRQGVAYLFDPGKKAS